MVSAPASGIVAQDLSLGSPHCGFPACTIPGMISHDQIGSVFDVGAGIGLPRIVHPANRRPALTQGIFQLPEFRGNLAPETGRVGSRDDALRFTPGLIEINAGQAKSISPRAAPV